MTTSGSSNAPSLKRHASGMAIDVRLPVSIRGFEYSSTETGNADRIALRMLDSGYDGRKRFLRRVFFPMADAKGG